MIGTHLIPASMDHGMSEVTTAGLLAITGLFDIVGTMVSGWLSDRYNNRWLLFWYYGLRGAALLRIKGNFTHSNLVRSQAASEKYS